jgi:hypothetical protein
MITQQYQWLVSLPSLIIISLIGMFIHFLKMNIKGETLTEICEYFTVHFKSTAIAVVVTVVSTIGYYFKLSHPDPESVVAAFGIGYMCDSLFNKWDKELKS